MKIKYSKKFKTDFKKYKNNKRVLDELEKVSKLLLEDKQLPEKYRLHELSGNLSGVMDCHLFGDVVLLYAVGESITFARLGNHNNLKLTESFIKLKISEDTTCIPAKTTYSEDGFHNGIYYFGEPRFPKSWRDYIKSKKKTKVNERMSNVVIREAYEDIKRYYEVDSKQVRDSDGFWDDYTMYEEYVIPYDEYLNFLKTYKKGDFYKDEWFSRYVFVFGDKELYDPSDGYDEFDWECESEKEAYEWFENYTGFDDEEDEDYY